MSSKTIKAKLSNREHSKIKDKIKNKIKEIKEKKEKTEKPKRQRPGSFSIAFQICVEELIARAVMGILFDIMYAVLFSFAVLYNAEIGVNGYFSWFDNINIVRDRSQGLFSSLKTTVIEVSGNSGTSTVYAGGFFWFLAVSALTLIGVQFCVLVYSCIVIPRKTYARLSPLFNMTEAAQALKNIDITDADINSGEELEIHTDKEELAGLEDAVNDLLRRTIESYKSQIRFVSDASHELRTPIAVIQGYANMLDRWGRDDKEILDESIGSIKSEAENMSRLVENLLFLARGDSGRAVIRFEEVDINQLICDIYDEFVMIDKTHNFSLDLRADITATIDSALIKQCLRILTDNAVKYSPEGTDIILRLQNRDEKYFSIEVQDHGIGIKQDEIDKIFERFYRSDPARNRQSGGYGLGLSIAKWIADKHNGFFEVLSYDELGTRISLILPKTNNEEKTHI
ncbi:MAG: HAMP domain-containing histidine kinase [Clostridia bacterium]|nr:HAMP domain-containing histidine kinase [Clostridia bacterium]